MLNLLWKIGIVIITTAVFCLPGLRAHGEPLHPSETSFALFHISPYLAKLTTTEAVLCWSLNKPGPCLFEYGSDPDCKNTVKTTPSRFHSVALTNLSPGIRYFYQINGSFASDFTTPSSEEEFKFVVIGHTHGTETFDHFPDEFLVEKIRQISPDFVIHTGDTTYFANEADFKRYFFDLFAPLLRNIPVFVSPGNHDSGWPFVHGIDLSVFKQLFPYGYSQETLNDDSCACYLQERGKLRFLFFSYVSLGKGGEEKLFRWLRNSLKPDRFNIVIFGGAQEEYYDREKTLRFLKENGAHLILNGDGAGFRREDFQGLPIYFVGTGGNAPHPFLIAYYHEPYLNVQSFDCTNKRLAAESFLIDTSLEGMEELSVKPSLSVSDHAGEKIRTYEFEWNLLPPLNSEDVSELAMTVNSKTNGYAWVIVVPQGFEDKPRQESGFRTQYLPIKAGDNLLRYRIPSRDPLAKENPNYRICKFILVVGKALEDKEPVTFLKGYVN